MEDLIANSGIQFVVKEMDLNPNQPLVLPNGKPLKYTFVEYTDFLNGDQTIYDVCSFSQQNNVYVSFMEAKDNNMLALLPDGRVDIDEFGIPKLQNGISLVNVTSYQVGDQSLTTINNLNGYRVRDIYNQLVPAFDLLLDNWLPMPMFEMDGPESLTTPMGWCRVKIQKLSDDKSGMTHYRFIWAFDTKTTTDLVDSLLRPLEEDATSEKKYKLCNRVDKCYDFLSKAEGDSAISDYIEAKLGLNINVVGDQNNNYAYLGFYIYLANYLRLEGAAPEIILHFNKPEQDINVDLTLDIGNSRTCGVLFENGDFTKARMLRLRDLSEPWRAYDTPFDMRLAFRKADFGNDIILDDRDIFNWHSLVRIGEEAKHLVYKSLERVGMGQCTTNQSSPKRYLWDKKPYAGCWEFLTIDDDPTNVAVNNQIFVENLTDKFDSDGTYHRQMNNITLAHLGDDAGCHYSRSSLMTFVLIEIFEQAMADINSVSFRTHHGDINRRRRLRNVIITCPTAMPIAEQITLRQSAIDAFDVLKSIDVTLSPINVTPSPDSLKITDPMNFIKKGWAYDEAFASQLVYLYAEICQRYQGENNKVVEMKGHARPELIQQGYDKKALTIGSIDIGAGTTDVMICSYQYDGQGNTRLTPSPLFWDSFYLAGDDILKNIIQNEIIEGPVLGKPDMGNIHSALESRMLSMSDVELANLPISQHNTIPYRTKITAISQSVDKKEREMHIRSFVSILMHDFFGVDSAMMSYEDRRCRNDFNTQISLSLAQFMLDLLSRNCSSKVYSFDEIFKTDRPSQYLLDHFADHFGFRFESLSWRFDPSEIASQVRSTMEPLMKQLSVVLNAYKCDILVLSGRPSSLDAITELFIKYYPLSPDRLIRLGKYRVGNWYPFADGQGYFYDQKSVVAVGAMVGYLAASHEFNGMDLDFSKVVEKMKSTANYIGIYNDKRQQVESSLLTPEKNVIQLNAAVFPIFLGCKQFDASIYSAKPLYAIYNHSNYSPLTLFIERDYMQNREDIKVVEVSDNQGVDIPIQKIEIVQQSLVSDGKYWLDKGEFSLSI